MLCPSVRLPADSPHGGLQSLSLTFESEYSSALAPPSPPHFSRGGSSAPLPAHPDTYSLTEDADSPDEEFQKEFDGNTNVSTIKTI